MNVSLTNEWEALRNQIRNRQQERLAASRLSLAEVRGVSATADYFERKRAALKQRGDCEDHHH